MFKKIKYSQLKARQKEIYNFHKIAALLVDYGFNCIKLSDDWQGADFLAYHINGETLKVQLKARLTIDKKYQDKDIYIAFPYNNSWYLIQHDKLVEKISQSTEWLKSDSWLKFNGYSTIKPNKKLLALLEADRI